MATGVGRTPLAGRPPKGRGPRRAGRKNGLDIFVSSSRYSLEKLRHNIFYWSFLAKRLRDRGVSPRRAALQLALRRGLGWYSSWWLELKGPAWVPLAEERDWRDFKHWLLETELYRPVKTREPLLVWVGPRSGLPILAYGLDYPTAKMVVLEPAAAHRAALAELERANDLDLQVMPYALDTSAGYGLLHRVAAKDGARYRLDARRSQSFQQVETRNLYWLKRRLVEPMDLLYLNVPGREEALVGQIDAASARHIRRLCVKVGSPLVNSARLLRWGKELGYTVRRSGDFLFWER